MLDNAIYSGISVHDDSWTIPLSIRNMLRDPLKYSPLLSDLMILTLASNWTLIILWKFLENPYSINFFSHQINLGHSNAIINETN